MVIFIFICFGGGCLCPFVISCKSLFLSSDLIWNQSYSWNLIVVAFFFSVALYRYKNDFFFGIVGSWDPLEICSWFGSCSVL